MLVPSDVWLANGDGSLSFMARSQSGFSRGSGSLWEMILFVLWLASFYGSLTVMARSLRWFSVGIGSLPIVVLLL